jgi:hypothetical protein
MAAQFFRNRTVLLVSMHQKEQAIAPPFEEAFGMQVFVSEGIDTDRLGTFSGEIPRAGTQLEAAQEKVRLGREKYPQAEIILASEGAFHPHPDSPFITINQELLLLHDFRLGLEISGSHGTLNNNAASLTSNSAHEILSFATRAGFPETGIILKTTDSSIIHKNLLTPQELGAVAETLLGLAPGACIIAETDLRAHRNPCCRNARSAGYPAFRYPGGCRGCPVKLAECPPTYRRMTYGCAGNAAGWKNGNHPKAKSTATRCTVTSAIPDTDRIQITYRYINGICAQPHRGIFP